MKTKTLLIAAIVFFIIVQLQTYIEYLPLGMGHALLFLVFYFLIQWLFALAALLLLINMIRKRDTTRLKIITLAVTIFVFVSYLYSPMGLYDLEKLEADNTLEAYRGGETQPNMSFFLRDNNTFIIRGMGLAAEKAKGDYTIVDDSVVVLKYRNSTSDLSKSYKKGVISADERHIILYSSTERYDLHFTIKTNTSLLCRK